MTREEVTSIALKVFALYILANILFILPNSFFMIAMFFSPFNSTGENPAQIPQLWLGSVSIFLIVIGIFVVFKIWKLSNSLAVKESNIKDNGTSGLSAYSLEPIILSSIGAFIAIDHFSHFARLVNKSIHIGLLSKNEAGFQISHIIDMAFELIVIGLGISLIVKSKWWVQLFKKYR